MRMTAEEAKDRLIRYDVQITNLEKKIEFCLIRIAKHRSSNKNLDHLIEGQENLIANEMIAIKQLKEARQAFIDYNAEYFI